jgi:hypothetical protein
MYGTFLAWLKRFAGRAMLLVPAASALPVPALPRGLSETLDAYAALAYSRIRPLAAGSERSGYGNPTLGATVGLTRRFE